MATENSRQVVADTRCTVPAADIAARRQNTTCTGTVVCNIISMCFCNSPPHLSEFSLEVKSKD